jgi:magnesium-protoporphyrin O-methyltransferase
MTCRQCEGIERFFDPKEAAHDLKSYRKKGPAKTTRMLIDALKALGVEGRTLLDIGGGVGAVQHELLKAGASGSVGVDASKAYLEAAKEEALNQGHADRTAYHHGDFVTLASEIEPADVVTLDRVVCCYHDMEELVDLSSQRAGKAYGLVYPRENWASRTTVRLGNLYFWLRRNPFRVFVHATGAIDSVLRRNGLQRSFYQRTHIWQVAVYTR